MIRHRIKAGYNTAYHIMQNNIAEEGAQFSIAWHNEETLMTRHNTGQNNATHGTTPPNTAQYSVVSTSWCSTSQDSTTQDKTTHTHSQHLLEQTFLGEREACYQRRQQQEQQQFDLVQSQTYSYTHTHPLTLSHLPSYSLTCLLIHTTDRN